LRQKAMTAASADKPKSYDLLSMGRSGIDLYANDIGVPFVEIKSFAAYVGGCPTNIVVGAQRLGLRTALLTAVGPDRVGDFIVHFLHKEGVATEFIPRKPGHRTSAVLLGIEGPASFPLTYYRDNCADNELNIDDVRAAPVADCKVLLIAGTNLSQEPSRSATLYAAEAARAAGATVVLDLDFRPDQWRDPRAYAVNLRAALRLVDIALGTDDEINAAMLSDADQITLTHSQVSDARVAGDVEAGIAALLGLGPRGAATKARRGGCQNTLGAASGRSRTHRRARLSSRGLHYPGRGRRLRFRRDLRLRTGVGLVQNRAIRQCLRRHRSDQTRLRQLHADAGGGGDVRGAPGRMVKDQGAFKIS
jgi:5-dehydro-2-deoxygluconokinase